MADAPRSILTWIGGPHRGLTFAGGLSGEEIEYIRADVALADTELAVAEGIRRAADACVDLADQVSDAALTGLPEQARLRESMAAAFTSASHIILALSPADALAEVQRLLARVTSLSEQVDTIAVQRDAALARVEKLRDTIRKAANRLDWCAMQLDDEAMIQTTIWADEARAALDEDARHG